MMADLLYVPVLHQAASRASHTSGLPSLLEVVPPYALYQTYGMSHG